MSTPREPDGGEFNFFAGRSRKMSRRRLETARKKKRQTFLPDFHGLERRMMPATYLVNTTADSGAGSLRQAILSSNGATPGPNTIDFDISGTGVQTISLLSALPSITVPVLIDGRTQPGYTTTPLIDLDGTSAGSSADGLTLGAGSDGSTIRALVINNFEADGILITTTDNTVASSFIGTNAAGTAAGSQAMAYGVVDTAGSGNTIGGTTAGTGNLISGNTNLGVLLQNLAASDNLVAGNLIGTDITGKVALPNFNGVGVEGAPGNTIGGTTSGAANLISGNSTFGVIISSAQSTGNIIAGNKIGTDITGTQALPNSHGVEVANGATNNTIGGLTGTPGTGAGNVISGNTVAGVYMGNETGNVVAGNLIGTDLTGAHAVPNDFGVQFDIETTNNTIGGTAAGAGNLISGNTQGINDATADVIAGNKIGTNISGTVALPNTYGVIVVSDSTIGGTAVGAGNLISGNATGIWDFGGANVVEGNLVGTNATGLAALGNTSVGIEVQSSGETIGGTVAGAGNTIAFNSGDAVDVITGTGDAILENLIFRNGSGIVLASGGNNNQIAPVITGVTSEATGATSAQTTIAVDLTAAGFTSGSIYSLDFFASAFGDPSSGVQAHIYLGTQTFTGGTTGNVTFTLPMPLLSATETVTATATLLSGSTFTDTSTFATPAAVSETSNFIVTNTNANGPGSLEQAILNANADTTLPTPYTITFAITPGSAPFTINLPSSGLTAIARSVVLDATSQTGYAGSPVIVLNGTGVSGSGLVLGSGSDGSLVRGFDVIDFTAAGTGGIDIASTSNAVQATYVGVQTGGSTAAANAEGILISGANNTIGGNSPGVGNLISGNAGNGITFTSAGATGNVVEGNLIGTDSTGEHAVANTSDGVLFLGGGSNTIGGSTSADLNVIASEGLRGIEIDPGSNSNLVEDNYIGTDAAGSVAMGAVHNGILDDGVSTSIIGNVIDASGNIGIVISGASTLVQGNLIGLNAAGTAALGNSGAGITIESSGNTIGGTSATARNVVSGSVVGLAIGIIVNSGTDNLIEGNYIGTNAAGTGALPNGVGINVTGGSGTTIGGATSSPGTGAGNVISGNDGDGLDLTTGSSDTTVIGNIIGLDPTGTVALENGSDTDGNGISTGSTGDTIGGTIAADRNIISGNYLRGITLGGTDEVVEGNFIGTDITGIIAIGNGLLPGYAAMYVSGSGNTIGGTVAGARNLLDGSGTEGIRLDSTTSVDNLVAGNYIGVNVAGTGALGNHLFGVLISNGATGNTIGGPSTAYANVISGNSNFGVDVDGATTTGDVVANDWIGTDAGGTGTLLNANGALVITNGASTLAEGSFTGAVSNQGSLGFFGAPSIITITGNYTQSSAGTLDADLGGTSLSQYDQLQVSGTATLAGTLNVDLLSSFTISPLEEFQIVTYGTVSGTFTTETYPSGDTLYPGYGPTSLFLYSTPFELVTTTADSGAGSLRQAITTADGLTNNPTWIVFNIPTSDSGYSSGDWTISPLSALPSISATIVLDCTTQPGFSTMPIIVLSGTSAGPSAAGVTIVAGGGGSTVRGFVVNGFAQDGIDLDGASNTTISKATLSARMPPAPRTSPMPARVSTSIPAPPATRSAGPRLSTAINHSGNGLRQVYMVSGSNGNVLEGNYIGTDVTGNVGLSTGTGYTGVYVATSGNIIGGTVAGAGNDHRRVWRLRASGLPGPTPTTWSPGTG